MTATLDTTSATVTGTAGKPQGAPALANPSIIIRSAGTTLVSGPLQPPAQALAGVQLWSLGLAPPSQTEPLCIVRFPGERAPTVLLGLYTGGAHCCSVLRAWSATDGASPTDEDNGNGGTRVTGSVNGAEIVTADNAFYYSFASFAASGAPVVVQTYTDGRFVDVTVQHLDLVEADATMWMSTFYTAASQGGSGLGGLGALAAWAADECRLAAPGEPWTTLSQLESQNMLNVPTGNPTGQSFIEQLRTFLTKHGYCTAP